MYKTIDLCAGIGGIRKGFERTGFFTNVLSAEVDEYAARTYQHLFGDDPRNDLTSPEFKEEVARTGYDVLLAGFPCQPFSSAGNKEGFSDATKGTIFFHIQKIIERNRPKAVFLENVQNIVSHDKGNTISTIINVLENELDYKIIGVEEENGVYRYNHDSFVRNTKYFGLPQNRPRAYFVAFDKKLYGNLVCELPNELPRERAGEPIFRTVDDILEPTVDIHYYMSATYLNTLERHAQTQKNKGNGFGYCIVNAPDRQRRYANTILATGGSGKERNLIVQPAPPYDPQGEVALKKKGGINTKNIRVMTPKEWGRLQGFVDYAFEDFSFPPDVPERQQYKQFGNSVSIPVIEEMALFLYKCIESMNKSYELVIANEIRIRGRVTIAGVMHLLQCKYHTARLRLLKMYHTGKLRLEQDGKIQYFYLR